MIQMANNDKISVLFNDDKYTNDIYDKIDSLFISLNFKKVKINDEINYVYNEIYCLPSCIEVLGFLIEYADSFEAAQLNMYDDGDSFPLDMGTDAILAGIEEEIRFNILKEEV